MPYVYLSLNADKIDLNENLINPNSKHLRAANWLSKQLNINSQSAQKLIDQGRLISIENVQDLEEFNLTNYKVVLNTSSLNDLKAYRLIKTAQIKTLRKADSVNDYLCLIVYAATALNIPIVYENEDFVVFNKPSGLLTHPNGRNSEVSLCDELWYKYGKDACVVHRLDAQTSGLILCAKHKIAAVKLKQIVADGLMSKRYQLIAKGAFTQAFCVGVKIGLDKTAKTLKNKMHIANDKIEGKISRSEFYPIYNGSINNESATFMECNLLTGRQHQIRVHLSYVGSCVVGDALYGVKPTEAIKYLENQKSLKSIVGVDRLMLHSAMIVFEYNQQKYEFFQEADFKLD